MKRATARKPGRPVGYRKPDAARCRINVRATDETIAQLGALADAWGCDKSDAIRRAIVDALANATKGAR